MEVSQTKVVKRRVKGKVQKKWMDKDVMKIISFLERHRQFEKPTAQNYYNRLLSHTGIEATCQKVRFKVRYLQRCFLKAEAWRNSAEAKAIENAEGVSSVIKMLERTCPFYNKLYDVFGYMIPDHENGFIDTESNPDKKCRLEFVESKARGNRARPNKKWMDAEVNEIINYIEREKEFEKPTGRVYYTKLLKNSNMNVTWDLLKWKVRNLKLSYIKAEAWRISNEAKLFESDEGIEKVNKKLQRMCPFYDRLNKIFGINSNCESDSIEDKEISVQNKTSRNDSFQELGDIFDMNSNCETDFVESEMDVSLQNELLKEDMEEMTDTFEDQPTLDNNSFLNQVANQQKKSVSEIVCIEKEKAEIQKLRIELDREKFSKEIMLRQQEIDLKRHELELRKLEIEKDERIRILEIEKDERLARLEIELKYRSIKSCDK
ncbi:uncharacterized protein LOC129612017 [Condylostylus longicornis]|uniref:uncharacterized protein LOC129612017 n=1 Tax=Condylostylus longicornis TaxID=2530218 RepID=UPI00244DBB47|nr:uncharacterized protein LOC129612017 [Condylostylus longicornis]